MSAPIVKVYDADGQLLHDCAASGCETSWDGITLATGIHAEGAAEPGEQWDTTTPGVARLEPAG